MYIAIFVSIICLIIGWYTSSHARRSLENNWRQINEYFFGIQKEKHSSSNINSQCFCKQHDCERFLSHDMKFHEGQFVTEKISNSLQKFFDCVIERYISNWYEDVSDNEDFVNDIKMTLHFVCDNALYRLKRMDLPKLISTKVVPAIARHLHMCMAAADPYRRSSVHHSENDRLFAKFSGHLHIAMESRTKELLYIRTLVTSILPHLVHNTVHNHSRASDLIMEEILSVAVLLPALDVLASPDIVNKLILIGLNNEPAPKPSSPISPNVKVLHQYHEAFRSRFRHPIPINNIQDLYRNANLFHQFMQYLKTIHLVDLLNVFGQLDEINGKVLQPEIPEAVKIAIHRDLSLLYESVAHESFLPLLQLPSSFLSDIMLFSEGCHSDVDRLQTCDSWFKTYDSVCSLLESILLPQFFDSDCYFDAQFNSSPNYGNFKSSSSLKRRDFSFSKLTGKVKDMFKLQSVVEGEFPSSALTATHQAEDAAALLLSQNFSDDLAQSDCEDGIGLDESELIHQEPDLSTWEVSMPTISQGYRQSLFKSETPFDDVGRRGSVFGANISPSQLTFVIEVREKGSSGSSWRIHRRYQEFYVLHEKLSEFHGTNLQDVCLPSRRSFGIKNFDFLEHKKPEFEQYLNKLLSKPFLYNSELLYGFLRQNDVEFNSSINIGKFMKSVNIKLKTRGQHLFNFMQTLVSSTEGRKPVPRSTECPSGRSLRDNNLHNHSFWNNASGAVRLRKEAVKQGRAVDGCDQEFPTFRGIMDVIEWILQWISSPFSPNPKNTIAAPIVRSKLLVSLIRGFLRGVRTFFCPLAESYLSFLISKALTRVLQEHRVVLIVELLRDVLFSDKSAQRTLSEKQQRREAANLAIVNLLLQPPFNLLFEKDELMSQLEGIFAFLQLQKVNKQLSYVLLDILVQELFPEVSETKIKKDVTESLSTTSSCTNVFVINGEIQS